MECYLQWLPKVSNVEFFCDLPETLIFQEYFLRKNLPKTKIQFIANANDEIDYQNRIILINADQLKRLKIKLNLIINVDSFCEMDKSSVKKYFNYAKKNGAKNIILLYCVSNYPSKISDFNLNNIRILKEKFNCTIGFSDHSKDHTVASSAIAAGAEIVEKHIALENQRTGFDIDFSLKGKEIKKFKNILNSTYKLLGKAWYALSPMI